MDTATFTVVASGTGTQTYQWSKKGAAISGATSTTYTTPATVSGDNGATFTVKVTNSYGNVTSSAATLTVTAAVSPSITTQPFNQTVTLGSAATFSVVASGTAPLSYQWSKNGAAINGATSASYTTPATVTTDNGATFTVKVTNSAGTVTSSAATLTVNLPPTITTQPANQTVSLGSTATFTVVASGTAPLTYQWSKSGTAISGATSASYTTPATVAGDTGATFTVKVMNTYGNVTSSAATLTLNLPPSITTQPVSKTVNLGASATYSVVASGTGTLTYQWSKGGTPITGATAASYTMPATVAGDSGSSFTVKVTNTYGSVTSNPATLTLNIPPTITTQPANQAVTVGATAAFSVTATGTGTLTYQWSKNGTVINGATAATYTTPVTVVGDSGATFTVKVTNSYGSVTSTAGTLTVNASPSITTQPASQTVNLGSTATFTVVASGAGPLSYQWSRRGDEITGATSASYTTPATVAGDNGIAFNVKVTNSYGTVTSSFAYLAVNIPPTITGFTPTSGGPGTWVTITGTNLAGATSIYFNGTFSSAWMLGPGYLMASAPTMGLTTGKITVTTPSGTATSASDFTAVLAPTFTSFTPTSGRGGTPVTITGTNLAGTTSVTFNGTVASFTASASSITAVAPSGVTTGIIIVHRPGIPLDTQLGTIP